MNIIFFIIFGGVLLFFIAYGVRLRRKDKRMLDEFEQLNDDRRYISGEQPFVERYKRLN